MMKFFFFIYKKKIFKKIYGDIFVIFSYLSCILSNKYPVNQLVLSDLFELYLLYEICEVYGAAILRVIF